MNFRKTMVSAAALAIAMAPAAVLAGPLAAEVESEPLTIEQQDQTSLLHLVAEHDEDEDEDEDEEEEEM